MPVITSGHWHLKLRGGSALGQYTNFFEEKSATIFDEENYEDELKKVIGNFRSFDKALDSFIVEHGYDGDINAVEDKVSYISEKCKEAGVPVPRNLKKWYTEGKRIERMKAIPFHLCFAFKLNIEEVEDFLRRICLSRGFDCHSVEEVVYFYAFKNGLSYANVQEILAQVPKVKPEKLSYEDMVFTDLIVEDIDDIDTEEDLVKYINDNIDLFGYNNAAAYDTIKTLWLKIAGSEDKPGVATRERKLLYVTFDKEEEAYEHYVSEKGRRERKRVDSIWEYYLQILGLAGSCSADFYKDRSLKMILKDNELMHPLAEDSFPDRDGLVKILNGEHVSYERVRKLLILLVFYNFYASRALKDNSYEVTDEEALRCISTIDDNLTAANYPTLYPGNPYDFLILMAIKTNQPLQSFRGYMQDLFFNNIDINSFYGE